jgi:aspartate ammonia-lyase
VVGITANPDRLRWFVEHSIGIVTALVPTLGYAKATQVAKEALESGRGVYDIVLEHKLLSRQQLDQILNPRTMV